MNHNIELKEGTIIVDGSSAGSVFYDENRGKFRVKTHTSMDSYIEGTHAGAAHVISLRDYDKTMRDHHDPDGKGYCDVVVDKDFDTEQDAIEFMRESFDRLGFEKFHLVGMEAK